MKRRFPIGRAFGIGWLAASLLAASTPSEPVDSQDEERPLRRLLEERPALLDFHMVGWVRDEQGLTVELRNSGQRYFFRGGRVFYGVPGSGDPAPGITGAVQGDRLILRDEAQRTKSLRLSPREGR